jgi:hypothetical protein
MRSLLNNLMFKTSSLKDSGDFLFVELTWETTVAAEKKAIALFTFTLIQKLSKLLDSNALSILR